jgi:hypothetical protein
MIRLAAKLSIAVALIAYFQVAPLSAAPVTYVSSTGSDANLCTATQPCATINGAFVHVDSGGWITCLNPVGMTEGVAIFGGSVTIDCLGALLPINGFNGFIFSAANQVLKIRNLTLTGNAGGNSVAIKVTGSGSLILENCIFENFAGVPALDIEPTGPFNLVIKNSRISNNGSGVLIKPAAGGSVTATFDGVNIVNNNGGGLKTDSTNGLVSVDISNSTITKNAGNGLNAVSGASGQNNMLNISHTVIAGNGSAGVQANGTNAAALIDTTLLDSNVIATSAVNGGRVLTYGSNRIVGADGSAFTGTAPLR